MYIPYSFLSYYMFNFSIPPTSHGRQGKMSRKADYSSTSRHRCAYFKSFIGCVCALLFFFFIIFYTHISQTAMIQPFQLQWCQDTDRFSAMRIGARQRAPPRFAIIGQSAKLRRSVARWVATEQYVHCSPAANLLSDLGGERCLVRRYGQCSVSPRLWPLSSLAIKPSQDLRYGGREQGYSCTKLEFRLQLIWLF